MVLVLSVTFIRIYIAKKRFSSTPQPKWTHCISSFSSSTPTPFLSLPRPAYLPLQPHAAKNEGTRYRHFACLHYHHSKNNTQPPPSSQALNLYHQCTLQSRRIRRQKRSENDSIKGLEIEHNAYLFCFMQCAERAGVRRDLSPQTPCQTWTSGCLSRQRALFNK